MIPLPYCFYLQVLRQQGKHTCPFGESNQYLSSQSSPSQPLCYRKLVRFSNTLYLISASLIQDFATSLLANNTFPALQKIKLDILPLPPLRFYIGFTKSKLISFPSWETVADSQMRVCFAARPWLFQVIEPGLLQWELAATTTLLEGIVDFSKHIRLKLSWP